MASADVMEDDVKDEPVCAHEHIEEHQCVNCGYLIFGDDGYIRVEEKPAKAPYLNLCKKYLQNKELPPQVTALVIESLLKAPDLTGRLKNRNEAMFVCVYQAYCQLDIKFNPEELAKKFRIAKCNLGAALRRASGLSINQLPTSDRVSLQVPMVVISPIQYLQPFTEALGISEYLNPIQAFAQQILDTNQFLYEERPKWMAAALIKYYAGTHGLNLPNLKTALEITPTSIKTCLIKVTTTAKELGL